MVTNAWHTPVNGGLMNSIWKKLKEVKTGLKKLNTKEFRDVDTKVKILRQHLGEIQEVMRDPNHSPEVFVQEREIKKKAVGKVGYH